MDRIILAITFVCVTIMVFAGIVISGIIRKKGRLSDEGDMVTQFLDKQQQKLSKHKAVIKPSTYVLITIACPIVLGVAGYLLTNNLILAIIVAALGVTIPEVLVKSMESKNAKKWDERFARALTQMASSLRAGLTIPQAVEDICQSPYVHESIRNEFEKINAGIKVNKRLGRVFEEFAERTENSDAYDLAAAIRLQEKIGGSEAEVVATISKNITDRISERRKVASKMTDAKMTVNAMDVAPVGILLIMFVAAKDFMNYYFTDIKYTLALVGIVAVMVIGSVVTRLMFNSGRKVD